MNVCVCYCHFHKLPCNTLYNCGNTNYMYQLSDSISHAVWPNQHVKWIIRKWWNPIQNEINRRPLSMSRKLYWKFTRSNVPLQQFWIVTNIRGMKNFTDMAMGIMCVIIIKNKVYISTVYIGVYTVYRSIIMKRYFYLSEILSPSLILWLNRHFPPSSKSLITDSSLSFISLQVINSSYSCMLPGSVCHV